MTDETKKLFDAPWAIEEEAPLAWYCVIDSKDSVVANDVRDQKTVNRLARLPELYDALMVAARVYCPYASFDCRSEEECPHIQIRTGICKQCVALGWIELMRKVRDGE